MTETTMNLPRLERLIVILEEVEAARKPFDLSRWVAGPQLLRKRRQRLGRGNDLIAGG